MKLGLDKLPSGKNWAASLHVPRIFEVFLHGVFEELELLLGWPADVFLSQLAGIDEG